MFEFRRKVDDLFSEGKRVFLLQAHLVFVVKYRKKLLRDSLDNFVKDFFLKISKNYDFEIRYLETDLDHIHLMVNYSPNISITQIVRILKQQSTFHLWKNFENVLSSQFWKEKTFWSDGYFVSSIGNVSQETLRKYIENQKN